MKEFPIVISFCTKDTPYEEEIQNLIASCERFGLEYRTETVPSFGSWELNCAYKPFFILKKLLQLRKPVLWVDADGLFLKEPAQLACFQSDFAVRINDDLDQDHPSKVVTSTIYVNFNEKGIYLLRRWAKHCKDILADSNRKAEFWDQMALAKLLLTENHGAHVKPLPLEYAKIFDHTRDNDLVSEPVIEHFQASRRYKHIINQNAQSPQSISE